MNIDQQIRLRFEELIASGEHLAGFHRAALTGEMHRDMFQWASSSLNLLSSVAGKNSAFYTGFEHPISKSVSHGLPASLGALKGAYDDYQKGFLQSLRTLIEAEVFDDFLEQAEHLLKSGYYHAAAIIAGTVLEDGLRKLCSNHPDIELPEHAMIDVMNGKLGKAGVYSKLTQKRITAIADTRNSAAHARWDDVKRPDVEKMVVDVREFMDKHF